MIVLKYIKRIIATLTGIFLLYPSYTFSQISEGGIPPSFNYMLTLRSAVIETKIPIDFKINDLRDFDYERAREGHPMPVAKTVSVDYTMDNSGYNTTLPGGENIWRLNLSAEDAVAIMLYYKDFFIPEGGKLFIYSADKSHVLGAYTNKTNPSGGRFATEFIGGDALVLEYVASVVSEEKPRIEIDEVGYGYNEAALREFCKITTRATSGSCMVDINCDEGAAWQKEKKGVCHTVQKVGRYSYICTGTLMNNTAEDFKPLILTARHCAIGNNTTASSEDMEQWLFYFNKEREGCGSEYLPAISKTMTGCQLLVNTGTGGGSDGMLLLLNSEIPDNYDVFYNGWDRRDNAASSGVSIHHPSGDYMKISTYTNPTTTYSFVSSEFNGDRNAHWNVIFAGTANGHGVTEGGSSGSPLYNENKLVVGTLTGGSSYCTVPLGLNIYGKLSYHWDKYQADSMHMNVWLDPLNLNIETFPGRFRQGYKPAPKNLRVTNMGNSISLQWDKPDVDESVERYNVYRNNSKIGETTLLNFIDQELSTGDIIYSVSAIYAGGDESFSTMVSIPYVKYKAPSNLVAERIDPERVRISWDPPFYEQVIYWGTTVDAYMIGFGERTKFYFGQKWNPNEIYMFNNNLIKAVQFFPVEKNTYEIYISQGSQVYRQTIDPSTYDYKNINTVTLDDPFVIDGSKSLIVAIYTTSVGSDYPAVCDNGPLVDGKGNIFSFDANEWHKLYNESNPERFLYNFNVSAVISSERGSITNAASSSKNMVLKRKEGIVDIKEQSIQKTTNSSVKNELYSSIPVAFPELTNYRIYRDKSLYKVINPTQTNYIDRTMYNNYYYEITAVYGEFEEESEKSNRTNVSPVDIEDVNASISLFPTNFSDYVYLKGYEFISRVDVLSISGSTCLVINNPDDRIDTSSLPSGFYFFRIYNKDNTSIVVKAIKTK
jgi:hypothetical protein